MRNRWRRWRAHRRYRILHCDQRKLVLTIERADLSRHWTPLAVVTLQEVERLRAGDLVEISRAAPPSRTPPARRGQPLSWLTGVVRRA